MTEQELTPLEAALIRAANDASARPEFYRLLLLSDVFVLGQMAGGPGERTVDAGEKLAIAKWQKQDGTPIIPFFSSLPALQRSISEQQSFLQLQARSLFETTLGAWLVLNPGSDYGKEFMPHEIEALLNTGLNQVSQRRIVQKETRVLLGEPANYPTAMVEALSKLFVKHASVKAAYVCVMGEEGSQEKPNLVIGIECDGDYERVLRDAGVVATDTAPKGEPVDIVQVLGSDRGLSQYFRESGKPFYQRSLRNRLGSLFGSS